MATLSLNVEDYPVREWVRDSTATSSEIKLTMQVTRDDPNAVTLRICNGNDCVDVDISDIELGQTATKTANVPGAGSAGTLNVPEQSIELCPGDTVTITAPADKARAYTGVFGQTNPSGVPGDGVILPGKSISVSLPSQFESCITIKYYDVDPATVLADYTLTFKLLDANGQELDAKSVTITDARPFDVQGYSGQVTVDVTEVL